MSEPVTARRARSCVVRVQAGADRSLGSFSSFAAGFSYISILTGMFQTAALGFLFAGRAFIWAWPFVFLGQMMVALQFAELAAHYPLAGSVYQWSKRLAGKPWAWNTGWIYLCAQIVTIPAVALGVAGDPAADLDQVPVHQVRRLDGRRLDLHRTRTTRRLRSRRSPRTRSSSARS